MAREQQKRSKWGVVGKVFLVIIVLIVSVLAIAYSTTDLGRAASDYKKNRMRAEKAGLFFTVDQVKQFKQVDLKDNGYDDFVAAKSVLLFNEQGNLLPSVKAQKAQIDSKILLLEKAVSKRAIVKPTKDSAGLDFSFSYLSASKGWVKNLTGLARQSATENDMANVRRYLLLASKLTMAVGSDKDTIAVLVRIASAHLIEATVKVLLRQHPSDPQWIEIFEATMKILDQPYNLLAEAKMGHYQCVNFYDLLQKEPMSLSQSVHSDMFSLPVRFSRYLPRFREASLSRVHERYANLAEQLPTDYYDFSKTQAIFEADEKFMNQTGWSFGLLKDSSAEMMAFYKATRKEVAMRNAIIQAIAALKTHADLGKGLPLKGRYAIDIDDRPIRVKKVNKGRIIYSIWGDGVDDGGKPIDHNHGDYVVHLSNATVPKLTATSVPE